MTEVISAEFPFESKYQEVLGSKMHYVEEGEGEPFLLLHGNPTSSYLWRNIIPHLNGLGRVVVPDLIGMGRSDKPDIAYRFEDHARYLDGFIEALGLKNITLVLHDWGSGLGFHYAARNPDNIKAIAFMEAVVNTMEWSEIPKEHKLPFKLFRAPVTGWFMLSVMNVFVNGFLPKAIVRKLGPEEMKAYRAPFRTVASRKPIRQWPREIPFGGTPADVYEIVRNYRQWLEKTELPKLMFHASPGAIITPKVAESLKAKLKNLEAIDLGDGIHYLQEDHPHAIGEGIANWYQRLGG